MDEFCSPCRDGNLQQVKTILEAKDLDKKVQKAGLEKALSEGRGDIVSYLLSLKPDIPIDSWTANHATYGGVRVYRQLHQKHPNIFNFHFGHQQSALHICAQRNDVALLSYILEVGAGEPGGDPDLVIERFTPLEWAGFGDSIEAAQILLIHGALKQTNALQFAAAAGSFKMVRALLEAGVDVNYIRQPGEKRYDITNIEYKSALQAAVEGYKRFWGENYKKSWEGEPEPNTEEEYLEVLRLLSRRGAHMYLRDDKGESSAWLETQKPGGERVAELFSGEPNGKRGSRL